MARAANTHTPAHTHTCRRGAARLCSRAPPPRRPPCSAHCRARRRLQPESVSRVLATIDKANGYCFGGSELGAEASVFTCAAGVQEWDDDRVGTVQERYMRDDDLSELLEPGGAR
eukprot:140557-Prymnesium_polylepis.2